MERIASHYGLAGLLDAIYAGLRADGKDLDALQPDDLAPVDEFHMRGREATVELAGLAQARPGLRVIDVGSGIGGSSRYLAAHHGCKVDGVDLTPEYCEIAAELSNRVGLGDRVAFHCASALELPFEDETFDLAWTQHVQMNIEDKPRLYAEILRVLEPGGLFVFHDILAGPGGPHHCPVHWAEDPSMSFMIAPEDLHVLLEGTGFEIVVWIDKTAVSHQWFLGKIREAGDGPPPNLGLHLLIGETAPAKIQNILRNLEEERIVFYQAALRKPSS